MAFKQPRVPEYRENESMSHYLKTLTLFLKDFCQEAWTASGQATKKIAGISYPVTSVNGKTGDVQIDSIASAESAENAQNAENAESAKNAENAENAEKLNGMTWASILDKLYPIGTVYMSAVSTSPASLFGGTWEQIMGRFLLAADAQYTSGSTGGEETHTLTIDEMPEHNHGFYGIANKTLASGSSAYYVSYNRPNSNDLYIKEAGGDQPHNNMPPYLAVYMWKRVS